MELQLAVLLLCVLRITAGFPRSLAPSQFSPGYNLLVPVNVPGINGPQVVLVPVSTDWRTLRKQNPLAQSEQTHTLTEPEQQHVPQMMSQNLLENQNVNSLLLLQPTVSPGTPLPENPLPQGQVMWNIPGVVPLQPGVNGQMFFPVQAPSAGGVAGGQRQSNSASSEEGDTQVIYILPISAEIPNMGIMEGGQWGLNPELTPNPNPNTNPDPNPGHLHLHPTPAPNHASSPAPSPALPAGVQEKNNTLGQAPPSVGAGQRTQTSCNHKGGAANAKDKTPLL